METPLGARGDRLHWALVLVKRQWSNKDFCLFGKLRLITLNNMAGSALKRRHALFSGHVTDVAGIWEDFMGRSRPDTHGHTPFDGQARAHICAHTRTHTHATNEYGAMSSTANISTASFIS